MSWDSEMAALSPDSWWKFAGDGADAGANGFTLSGVGSPSYVASLVPSQGGVASNAVQLNGSTQYFTDGDNYGFETAFASLQLSISFWIKVESANFASGSQRIISKRAGSPFEGWALHGSAGDNLSLLFDYGATEEAWIGDTALTNGTTAFVVSTFDGSVPILRTYIDGFQVSTDTTFTNSGTLPDTTAVLEVGAERSGNNKFQGILDEVAVWDGTVLSAPQIEALWDAASEVSGLAWIRA